MKREKITHTLASIDDQGLLPNELFNHIQPPIVPLVMILQVCNKLT